MATRGTCSFCGDEAKLTSEHVLGSWLTRIGLDLQPVQHRAGALSRVGRNLGGVRPPFRQTVRSVCATCNNGWMSRLEMVAERVLSPFILGTSGAMLPEDHGPIAAWVQKSALVAMLVLSEAERTTGHGLPQSEYRELYRLRDTSQPISASQFWVGRYEGTRSASVHVVPLVLTIEGLPEPDRPQGYATTIGLGQLLLHAVRFTTPSLQVELAVEHGMAQLWPPRARIDWPGGRAVTDDNFLSFTAGNSLLTTDPYIAIRPWRVATDLPDSRAIGNTIELPTACGEHVTYYPAMLVHEAQRGRFYTFMTSCSCPMTYLVETRSDGAHCREADAANVICELYDALPGDEFVIEDADGTFVCKRRTVSTMGSDQT